VTGAVPCYDYATDLSVQTVNVNGTHCTMGYDDDAVMAIV
jgi:hypothetical protein